MRQVPPGLIVILYISVQDESSSHAKFHHVSIVLKSVTYSRHMDEKITIFCLV